MFFVGIFVGINYYLLVFIFYSQKNRIRFDKWNQGDPVDEWECERAKRIKKIQGSGNEIVWDKC